MGALGCAAPLEVNDVSYDSRFGSTTLDLYLPNASDRPHPLVLFIHGGGLRSGDKRDFYWAATRLARSGFVASSINYRLLPEGVFPVPLQDSLCALAFLRANAAAYAIDPERVAVMGYSAGAWLASLVGLAAGHPQLAPDCDAAGRTAMMRPTAVISASGPQDMRTFWNEASDKAGLVETFNGSPAEVPHAYELGSPRYHVGPGAPAFLLLMDVIDVGGVAEFRQALVDAGNDARLLKVDGSLHILEQRDDAGLYEGGISSETPEAWIAIEDFLFRTIAKEGNP